MAAQAEEAASESTSPDRLSELVKQSRDLAQIVAQNCSAPPTLLRELASIPDPLIRQRVAANPNTPTKLLLRLGAEFPEQLLANPIFDLLLLENPNLPTELPSHTLASIVKIETVPSSFLEQAARQYDEEVVLALTQNPKTPKSVLEILINHPSTQVREAAMLHINWSGEMTSGWHEAVQAKIAGITWLQHDPRSETKLWNLGAIPHWTLLGLDRYLRYEIARHSRTPITLFHQLINDPDPQVRCLVAANHSVPDQVLQLLAKDQEPSVRQRVAQNPNYGMSELGGPEARLKHAQDPTQDPELLKRLAHDAWDQVRREVVRHPNLSESLLPKLAQDPDAVVRKMVVAHPKTPTSWLEYFAVDKEQMVRVQVAQAPHLSLHILEQLAQDQNVHVRMKVAVHPSTPENILSYLAQDRTARVRRQVATNPRVPGVLLMVLARERKPEIRQAVANNPNYPLLALGSKLTRLQLAQNLNTAPSVLKQLAQDAVDEVCRYVAAHCHTPVSALSCLAHDPDEEIRRQVAINPHTPVTALEQLAQDVRDSVRMAVASNPNTPVCKLKLKPSVRLSLVQQPDVPVTLLTSLSQDPDLQQSGMIHENSPYVDSFGNSNFSSLINHSNSHLTTLKFLHICQIFLR